MAACESNAENDSAEAVAAVPEDLCELLNEDLVKFTFNLSEDMVFEKSDSETICMYDWSNDAVNVFYSVSLNFAPGGQRSEADAMQVWKSQNEGVYEGKSLKEVAGVGDKASWSTLGGGQLRVLYDGFYSM